MAEQDVESVDRITVARLGKLARLEAAGVRAFPTTFARSHRAQEIHADFDALSGQRVCVAGRLDVFRKLSSNLVFVDIKDESGRIQLMLHPRGMDDAQRLVHEALDPGDFVGACGTVIKSKTGEVTVEVSELSLLSKSLRNPPEKWHGLVDVETRYRQRYLDLMANIDTRQVFLTRSRVIGAIRRYLDARGFVEVETPVLQTIPGGGAARPFATESYAMDARLYLRIALELYLKRCIIGGIERVYEIGRNFRNEGVDRDHNTEFTMLEAYQAYGTYEDMMELLEALVREAALAVRGSLRFEYRGREMDLETPWRRVTLLGSVSEATGEDVTLDRPDLARVAERHGVDLDPKWGPGKIVLELYERLVEPELFEPTFVRDFPREVSPLARPHRSNPGLTEHVDLIMAGTEIAPAYSELSDPDEQRARFEDQLRLRREGDEEAHPLDEDFLAALEHGMPPAGGLGLGVDRLTMILADQPSLRDVIAFPAVRPETE